MNSSRGRGRGGGGGGGRRPYYYFRRNGRTIPACGNAGEASSSRRGWRRRGGRGAGGWGTGGGPAALTNVHVEPVLDSSFLRPQIFAAPEDALKVLSVAVESPKQCPGFRLYFHSGKFDADTDLGKRIITLCSHYTTRPHLYDLRSIHKRRCFAITDESLKNDLELMAIWPTIMEDMRQLPLSTLATLGAAMHVAVQVAVDDISFGSGECSRTRYVPRLNVARKIYVRPDILWPVDLVQNIEHQHMDTLYTARGTVVAMGGVESFISWMSYCCARCKQEQMVRQQGNFLAKPMRCKREQCIAKSGFLQERSSVFTQIRTVQVIRLCENNLQALNEYGDVEQQYIDIELRHDLVDSVCIGQDVIVTGVLKMRPIVEDQGQSSNTRRARLYLKAVAIRDATMIPQTFTEPDLNSIAAINGDADSFKLLTHSVAPEMHGQEIVKVGILLSLLGGAGSQLHDDSEINTLIVGDPGIGKSHLVEMASLISEKGSLNLSRKGAAAGKSLTVSLQGKANNVTVDGGNMLQATRGHCAIDDIDRLASQQDNLLQVLQSHRICLPLAMIHANIKAPAALIASANSANGHYNHSKSLADNIKMSPSLLREFHLALLVIDRPNKSEDASFTEHVRAMHDGFKKSTTIAERYAGKIKTNTSISVDIHESKVEDESRYDLADRLKWQEADDHEMLCIPPVLMKKFITYARQKVKPLLTEGALDALKHFYFDMRDQKAEERFNPIAISQLHGLIWLAQARARVDFSTQVSRLHVIDVICLMRQCQSDTAIGNYVDTNPSTSSGTGLGTPTPAGRSGQVKRFLQMLQMRSSALGRRIFDFDDLKDMASRAGILCGVTNLIEMINMQGYLIKKGPNMYEVMEE